MQIKKKVLAEIVIGDKFFTDVDKDGNVTECYIYELMDIVPNAEGFYELYTGTHYSLPPMLAQNLLNEFGFSYVGKKRGNYDIELWAKALETKAESLEPLDIVDDRPVDNHRPQDHNLNTTPYHCYQCGCDIGEGLYTIVDNHDRLKTVSVRVCMNPGCNFASLETERK